MSIPLDAEYADYNKLLLTEGVRTVLNGIYNDRVYVIAKDRGKFNVILYMVAVLVINSDEDMDS